MTVPEFRYDLRFKTKGNWFTPDRVLELLRNAVIEDTSGEADIFDGACSQEKIAKGDGDGYAKADPTLLVNTTGINMRSAPLDFKGGLIKTDVDVDPEEKPACKPGMTPCGDGDCDVCYPPKEHFSEGWKVSREFCNSTLEGLRKEITATATAEIRPLMDKGDTVSIKQDITTEQVNGEDVYVANVEFRWNTFREVDDLDNPNSPRETF